MGENCLGVFTVIRQFTGVNNLTPNLLKSQQVITASATVVARDLLALV